VTRALPGRAASLSPIPARRRLHRFIPHAVERGAWRSWASRAPPGLEPGSPMCSARRARCAVAPGSRLAWPPRRKMTVIGVTVQTQATTVNPHPVRRRCRRPPHRMISTVNALIGDHYQTPAACHHPDRSNPIVLAQMRRSHRGAVLEATSHGCPASHHRCEFDSPCDQYRPRAPGRARTWSSTVRQGAHVRSLPPPGAKPGVPSAVMNATTSPTLSPAIS